MPKSLSMFFPCYNDAGTIGSMVVTADTVARELTDDYEIVVIDDGSRDNSRLVLKELAQKYDRLRLIFHERNKGYGGALRSGFKNATKELVFYTDGDGQYDVTELKKLYPVMQDGIDIVNGYKIERNDPLHRIIIGNMYLLIMRMMFGFKVRDVDCDFRLIRTKVFNEITLKYNSGVICLELVKKLEKNGFLFAEIPVNHFHRTYGKSQFFNFKRVFRVGVDIIKLWYELNISTLLGGQK